MGFAFQAISPYFLLERTQGRMQQNGKAGNPAWESTKIDDSPPLSTTDRLAFSEYALSPRLSSIPSLPFLSRVLPYSSHSPDESGIRLLRYVLYGLECSSFHLLPMCRCPAPVVFAVDIKCVEGTHASNLLTVQGPPIVKCKKSSTANRKDWKMLFKVCCHFCHFRDLLNLMIEIRLGWIWKVTADEINNKTEQRRTYQDLTKKLENRMQNEWIELIFVFNPFNSVFTK